MEEILCVGIQHLDFQNRDGERVLGTKVYYTQHDSDGRVEGVKAGSFWIAGDFWCELKVQPKVNGKYVVYYNRYGKVSSFVDAK